VDRSRHDLSRRDLLRYGAAGAIGLATTSALAACGGSSGGSGGGSGGGGSQPKISPGPARGGTPVKGGILTVGALSGGQSETLNPGVTALMPDMVRVFSLYDPLFIQVPGGVAPGLATAAEANKDATAWTLKLRDGVTWHDGKSFTADDVVYTIKSWGTKASQYQTQATALIDLRNVRKIDRLTVHVPLKRPAAWFPAFTSFYTALVLPAGGTDFKRPVGTGPFKFGSFTPGSHSAFTANENYWRGPVHIDQLVVDSTYTDEGARINALLDGRVDIVPGVTPALAKANSGSGRIVLGNSPGPAMAPLIMRIDVAPFNDPRVVQAFKLAIKRQTVIDSAFGGYATLGNDLPGATLKYWASDIKASYDPEKAKALLKAAGRENLSLPLYTSPAITGMNESATILSSQLKDIGVTAQVKTMPVDTYYTNASNPAYLSKERTLYIGSWPVFQPALGAFYDSALKPTGQYPETGWGKKPGQLDLITAAAAELDPATATQKWRAVPEQQLKEGGYMVPANFNYLDAYAPHVRGVETNQAGNNANYIYYNAWLQR
jgi:peptide/nickel transport system substrate-binding protein